eukprot:7170811-Pyramimonas_sp.AAC.1
MDRKGLAGPASLGRGRLVELVRAARALYQLRSHASPRLAQSGGLRHRLVHLCDPSEEGGMRARRFGWHANCVTDGEHTLEHALEILGVERNDGRGRRAEILGHALDCDQVDGADLAEVLSEDDVQRRQRFQEIYVKRVQ